MARRFCQDEAELDIFKLPTWMISGKIDKSGRLREISELEPEGEEGLEPKSGDEDDDDDDTGTTVGDDEDDGRTIQSKHRGANQTTRSVVWRHDPALMFKQTANEANRARPHQSLVLSDSDGAWVTPNAVASTA
eukprot:1989456-Rhodomonas_salina.1